MHVQQQSLCGGHVFRHLYSTFALMFAFQLVQKNACVTLTCSVLNRCHSDDSSQTFHYLYLMRSLSDVFFFFLFFLSLTDFPSVIEIILSLLCLPSPPQFCGAIVTELDALLPLAAACRESSLLEVRSSFVEACGRAAFAVLDRLQERALEVPTSAPLKNLPALLATCIYVLQRLEHYRGRLKDSNATAAKV